MAEVQFHGGGPIPAQENVAIDGQLRVFELGASGQAKFLTLGDRVNGEVSGALVVEGEVAKANGGVDGRFFQRARSHGSEIHAALNRGAAGLQPRDAARSKLAPVKLKWKAWVDKL